MSVDYKALYEASQAALKAANEAATKKLTFKVSPKGAVQVNGMGRFPTTLYKQQMLSLLDRADDIRKFIEVNQTALKSKGE